MPAYCCTGHASTTCAWDKGTNAEELGLWWTVTRIMNNWCSQTQVSLEVLENISRHNNSVGIIKMTWRWRFNKAIFADSDFCHWSVLGFRKKEGGFSVFDSYLLR